LRLIGVAAAVGMMRPLNISNSKSVLKTRPQAGRECQILKRPPGKLIRVEM
jgi:hypothetical protein